MKAVFVLVDAMGWAYLKDRSFLPEILTYRAEVRTVLGFSSGAIPAILSGRLPRETDRWNLFYYDPANSPFWWVRWLQFLPGRLLNWRGTRKAIRIAARYISGFKGYFQIYGVPVELLPYFDISEKEDIYLPGGVPNSIFDHLREQGMSYRSYSYHQFSDDEIIREASKDARAGAYDVQFLYLCELDAFLHRWCHDEARVEKEMRRYEKMLGSLHAAASQAGEELAFFVFSDHGMTAKKQGFDIIDRVSASGLKEIRDYIGLYDSTMARFWAFSPGAREKLEAELNQIDCGHILSPAELRDLGLDFSGNQYGDIIFLMDPGVMIEPSFMGTKAPPGMHGFHPDDIYSAAALLGNRTPGLPVRTLTDFYALMVHWAGRVKNTEGKKAEELVHA